MGPDCPCPERRRLLRFAAACVAGLPWVAPAATAPGAMLLLDDEGRRLALLDATSLAVLRRWPADGAVHGQPAFTPDGLHAFVALRDGAIARHGLGAGAQAARAHAGADPRGLALSADGQWLLAAHGAALTLFDRDLQPVRRYPGASLDGKVTSSVAAVFHAAARRSFVVAFDTLPELWEISYDRAAPPIFDGLVHDYRMGEAIASSGFLGVRRTPLEEPFTALTLDASHRQVLGAAAGGTLAVLNLDVRRRIARLPFAAASPELLADFVQQGAPRLAVAGAGGTIHVAGAAPWRLARTVRFELGDPLWLRTHPGSAHLWLVTQAGDGALLTLIDKDTLQAAATIAMPGRLLGTVAFAGDGRAWIGVRDGEDAVLVVDERRRAIAGRVAAGANPAVWRVP